MTDCDEPEGTPTAASSTPGWTPEWALPNITLDQPIEAASYAALVPTTDERLRAIAVRRPLFKKFLSAFRDEFRNRVSPTIVMLREDAPPMVKTDVALGGFLDAVCISAIVAGHCNSSIDGIVHSDAFDIYPWFPNPQREGHLGVVTPAMIGIHSVDQLRPQPAPALGRRSLSRSAMDQPLLEAILARWRHCFVDGNINDRDLRLFRSLEMARAASKVPGGANANIYDAGRAVALWVSAFEILAHDGVWANLERVLLLLGRVEWLSPELSAEDRCVKIGRGKTFQTNLAGAVYDGLYGARNHFVHGNPVAAETLKLGKRQTPALWLAAPLFRLALTAFLGLRFPEPPKTKDAKALGRYIAERIEFQREQRRSEEAILVADDGNARQRRFRSVR